MCIRDSPLAGSGASHGGRRRRPGAPAGVRVPRPSLGTARGGPRRSCHRGGGSLRRLADHALRLLRRAGGGSLGGSTRRFAWFGATGTGAPVRSEPGTPVAGGAVRCVRRPLGGGHLRDRTPATVVGNSLPRAHVQPVRLGAAPPGKRRGRRRGSSLGVFAVRYN